MREPQPQKVLTFSQPLNSDIDIDKTIDDNHQSHIEYTRDNSSVRKKTRTKSSKKRVEQVSIQDAIDNGDSEQLKEVLRKAQAYCIRRQRWEHDKSFLFNLKTGDERAFTDIEDFKQKRAQYYRRIRAIRAGKPTGERGERKTRRYSVITALKQLRYVTFLVFALFAFRYAMVNRFFLPEDKMLGGQASPIIQQVEKKEPTQLEVAMQYSDEPLGDDERFRPEDEVIVRNINYYRSNTTIEVWRRRLLSIGYGILLWWFMRKLFRMRRIRKNASVQEIKVTIDMLPD